MVVAGLHSHVDGVASGTGGLSEGLREEVFAEEIVTGTLINEDGRLGALVLADELARVVSLTSLDGAKILSERIHTERLSRRSDDGSEGRDRLEHARVLEMKRDGAVATHAMASDSLPAEIDGEQSVDELRKLLGHISLVLAMVLPLGSGSIDVEASAGANPPVFGVGTLDGNITGRGVREHDSEVVLGGLSVNGSLGARVLISARETGEVEEDSGRLLASLVSLRDENGESHLAVVAGTVMLDSLQVATFDLLVLDLGELGRLALLLDITDLDDGSEAVATVQSIDRVVNVLETLDGMREVLVDLQLFSHDALHKLGHLGSALPATEGGTLPHTTSDELERTSGDLVSGSGNTNDATLTPATMSNLESISHDLGDTGAIEREVVTPLLGSEQRFLHITTFSIHRVVAVRGTHLLGDLELLGVQVDSGNDSSTSSLGSLNDSKTDGTESEDGDTGAGLHVAVVENGTPAGGNTATKHAHMTEISVGVNLGGGNLSNNRVLSERRAAHEVVDSLAVFAEARGAVGHDTLALGRADLGTQVRSLALTEDAVVLAALGSVARNDDVTGLKRGNTLADRLNNTSGLVTKDGRELALGVMAVERVDVSVAESIRDNLDADFASLRRRDLHVRHIERLLCLPGNGGLARDRLTVGGLERLKVLLREVLSL